jgi:segregation and condensation protein A
MNSYSVTLDVFCGPLELLLQLIRTDEIEITEISLARVADQFVEYLRSIDFSDLEIAADFIVVACHLMELKSRQLLPEADQGAEVEALQDLDKGSDLIEKLLEYRRVKDLSRRLRERWEVARRRFPRGTVPEIPRAPVDLEAVLRGVTLWDMVSSYARIAREIMLDPRRTIVYDDIPIGDHIDRILEYLRSREDGEFSILVESHKEKARVIGAFLALLELVRQKLVQIRQPEDFGEIYLKKADPRDVEEEAAPPADGPGAPAEEGEGS